MSINLNLDQRRLIANNAGRIVCGKETFMIYDLLAKTMIELPLCSFNEVSDFLSQKPAIVACEASSMVPSLDVISLSSSSNEKSGPERDSGVEKPPCPTAPMEIWIKNSGKPSPADVKAREDLINLVKSKKYQKLLLDKNTTKKSVFDKIAQELQNKGYSFGERQPWMVCKQKWKNMESETLKVIAAAGPKNSGGGQVKKPDYFDEIFDIVKDTAKACPKNIQDSLPSQAKAVSVSDNQSEDSTDTDRTPVIEEDEERTVSDGDPSSPFLKVKASSKTSEKRRVNTNEILQFLKEDSAERQTK